MHILLEILELLNLLQLQILALQVGGTITLAEIALMLLINYRNITLAPGDFRIYTTVKLPTPEPGILLDVESD